MNLKEQFARKPKMVEVAGMDLEIYKLSIGDKDAIRLLAKDEKYKQAEAQMVMRGCPAFKDSGEKYIVEDADPDLINELLDAIKQYSGMGDKEAEKNSEAIQDSSSATS